MLPLEAAIGRQGASYTPEIVVDGASSDVGSDRSEVGPAVERRSRTGKAAPAGRTLAAGVTSADGPIPHTREAALSPRSVWFWRADSAVRVKASLTISGQRSCRQAFGSQLA